MNTPRKLTMTMQAKARLGQLLSAGLLALASGQVVADDSVKGVEKMLTIAQQDKKGVTIYVGGQTVGGAVLRIEPGQWVELRNQQFGRLVIRLDRIDAVALP
jgi:hypothetical protein